MSEKTRTHVRVALRHLDIAAVKITMPARGVERGHDGNLPRWNLSLFAGEAVTRLVEEWSRGS